MIASEWSGEPQPYYWDIQPGGSFWFDYDAGRVDDRSDVRPPVPAQGQNQDLDETWVTHFLWHLREGDGGAATRGGLYDDPGILWTFGSKRMKTMDRAGAGTDLVDFLDALACRDREGTGRLWSFAREEMGFPWDGDPSCPSAVARTQGPDPFEEPQR
ncbi:hypothetical protein KBD49_10510, partial [Myxococcota bacterium]|nr:hypothetical protein [Myxococcota bacterium]